MGSITLWVGAIVIPSLGFLLNFIGRLKARYPLSASADWVLLLIVFDAVAIVAKSDFEPFVQALFLREAFLAVFMTLLILTIILWLITIMHVEPWVEKSARKKIPKWKVNLGLVVTWIGALFLTMTHILIFTWKAN